MADHTYLFEPARWEATGVFMDAAGETLPMEGYSIVLHGDEIWSLTGRLHLKGEPTVKVGSDCRIVPFPEGELQTSWTASDPALGTLTGRFIIVGDTILSSFESDDHLYRGTEWLRQLDADTYESRGVLLQGERLLSAWTAELKRER